MASLADGQLPTSEGVLYEVTHGQGVSFEHINFHNTNIAVQTVKLYVRRDGSSTSRVLRQWSLNQFETGVFLAYGERLELGPGDQLRAETNTASAVDYVVVGTLL